MTGLEQYFNGGNWRPEYDDANENEVSTCLSTPSNALKIAWSPECASKLSQILGSRRRLENFVRDGIDSILREQAYEGRLDEYECAAVRLLVESVLAARSEELFPFKTVATRREWVQAIDGRRSGGGNFAGIKGLRPTELLRLAVSRVPLQHHDARVRDAVAQVVTGALRRILADGVIPIECKVRLVAIRYWVIHHEGDGGEQPEHPADLLAAAGLDVESVRTLVDDLRNERGVERLATTEGSVVDLTRLLDSPGFRESAERYQFRFDPTAFELLRSLSSEYRKIDDPWVSRLYSTALGSSAHALAALAEIQRLGEGRRVRSRAIEYFCGEGRLGASEASETLQRDLASHGDGLYQRIFHAAARARFIGRWPAVLKALEEAGLRGWFDQHWDAFCRSSGGGRIQRPDDVIAAKVAESVSGWRSVTELAPFAPEIVSESQAVLRRIEQARARDDQRTWLYDLTLSCEGKQPEDWDGRRGIFMDEDIVLIRQFLQSKARGTPRWWIEQLNPWQEMRMREASARATGQGLEELESIVRRNADRFASLCADRDASRQAALTHALDQCFDIITSGAGSMKPTLLRAFRRGDDVEFEQLLFPDDDLGVFPPVRRPPRLVGKRVIAFGLLTLAAFVVLFWRVITVPASEAPASVRDGRDPDGSARVGAPFDPNAQRWNELAETKWWTATTDEDFRRLITHADPERRSTGRALKACELAEEYVRRLKPWLQASHPAGLRLDSGAIITWDRVNVRLPGERDESVVRTGGVGGAGVWLSEGRLSAPGASSSGSVDARGYIHVILEISE